MRRCTIDARYVRQLVVAEDGGTIGLDYFHGSVSGRKLPPDAPVLLVLHGVSGRMHAWLDLERGRLPRRPPRTPIDSMHIPIHVLAWVGHRVVECSAMPSMHIPPPMDSSRPTIQLRTLSLTLKLTPDPTPESCPVQSAVVG